MTRPTMDDFRACYQRHDPDMQKIERAGRRGGETIWQAPCRRCGRMIHDITVRPAIEWNTLPTWAGKV